MLPVATTCLQARETPCEEHVKAATLCTWDENKSEVMAGRSNVQACSSRFMPKASERDAEITMTKHFSFPLSD